MNLVLSALNEAWMAVRRLARAPGFLIPAVATIAVGIGATSAIFTLVNGVLIRPLSYPDAERLVVLTHEAPKRGFEGHSSNQIYARYRSESRTLEQIGAYQQTVVNVTYPGDPEQLNVALVTPSVFSVLGAQPHRGRLFTEEEGRPGAPSYVIISHGLWLSRYGGDEEIVSREIELNGRRSEIVGVMPPEFSFPTRSTQVWYNFGPDPLSGQVTDLYLRVIGRARDGVTPSQVEQDLRLSLTALQGALAGNESEFLGELRVVATTLKDAVVGDVREALLILLCAVGFLMLVASANVINLFLLRSESNQRSVAVRRALGAGAGTIRRYWLIEALIVSVFGGVLGVAAATVAVSLQFGFEPGQIPRLDEVRLGAETLAVVVLLVILTALVIVGALELHGRRVKTAASLAIGRGSDTSPSQQRVQKLLVGSQVALALVMLLCSATAARGLSRVLSIELGFSPKNIATVSVRLPFRAYRTYAQATRFHEDFLNRIGQAPGVISAGVVTNVPLTEVPDGFELPIAAASGAAIASDESGARALYLHATPSYFKAMRIRLLAGKLFEASDARDGVIPVVISRGLAVRLAGSPSSAPGLRLRGEERARASGFVVTGVVADTVGEELTATPSETVYLPVMSTLPDDLRWPLTPPLTTTVVRTAMDPSSVVASVREALRAIDPRLPMADVRSMDSRVEGARARHRLIAILLAVAAGATLLLGVVGIYGVTSYAVNSRRHEFAVRMALGATASNIQRSVLGGVTSVLAVGAGVGLALFAGLSRFLRSVTYGVDPADGMTVIATVSLLGLVALLAGLRPALQAGRSNPAQIIGAE